MILEKNFSALRLVQSFCLKYLSSTRMCLLIPGYQTSTVRSPGEVRSLLVGPHTERREGEGTHGTTSVDILNTQA